MDTLFFRGAEPMNIGEDHSASSIFPPSTQTISGALRTTVLIQNEISFKDYDKNSFNDEKIVETIGKYNEDAPFTIIGPLFLKNKKLCIPAPYNWYMEKANKKIIEESSKKDEIKKFKIIKSAELKTDLIKAKTGNIYWAKPEKDELISLGGYWIFLEDLYLESDGKYILSPEYFVSFEQRTGIALQKNRAVREGHIYAFNHVRLHNDVDIVFGIDKNLPIKDKGVLKFGAEQRFGQYKQLAENERPLFRSEGGNFLTLSIMPRSDAANQNVMSTGKILYIGGWDLAKGFHKPMRGYFPSGSVFSEKINENCIAIK
ncbi:MAG: type III-B CRISPR module-associated Cmr3 family protein [Campylobacterota bacterium]|nr:type III-B CRISPR module-associated Cmr3 family protein [Campylobacterota bacterium]